MEFQHGQRVRLKLNMKEILFGYFPRDEKFDKWLEVKSKRAGWIGRIDAKPDWPKGKNYIEMWTIIPEDKTKGDALVEMGICIEDYPEEKITTL